MCVDIGGFFPTGIVHRHSVVNTSSSALALHKFSDPFCGAFKGEKRMCPFLHSSNMPCTQKLNNIQHPNKTLTHAHRHSEQNLRERGKERERQRERERERERQRERETERERVCV